MKTLDFENTVDIFADYALSNEDMINVHGGEAEGEIKPPNPPIKV